MTDRGVLIPNLGAGKPQAVAIGLIYILYIYTYIGTACTILTTESRMLEEGSGVSNTFTIETGMSDNVTTASANTLLVLILLLLL